MDLSCVDPWLQLSRQPPRLPRTPPFVQLLEREDKERKKNNHSASPKEGGGTTTAEGDAAKAKKYAIQNIFGSDHKWRAGGRADEQIHPLGQGRGDKITILPERRYGVLDILHNIYADTEKRGGAAA